MKKGAVVLRNRVKFCVVDEEVYSSPLKESNESKSKSATYQVTTGSLAEVLKDLYYVDPEKRMAIIAKLDAAFDESKGKDDKFFALNLHEKLIEINVDLNEEIQEINSIKFRVNELLKFINHKLGESK
jgi:hypothetical protein